MWQWLSKLLGKKHPNEGEAGAGDESGSTPAGGRAHRKGQAYLLEVGRRHGLRAGAGCTIV